MPKKKKGKKKRTTKDAPKRALLYKEDMQEYVLMTKMLGDRRIKVMLPDMTEKLAVIPGRFRKRCWMKAGDILLASYREFQEDKLDIIHKYTPEEARQLVGFNEIPSFFVDATNGVVVHEKEESNVVFVDENDENEGFDFDSI